MVIALGAQARMRAAVRPTPTNARQAGCLHSQARDYITGVFCYCCSWSAVIGC